MDLFKAQFERISRQLAGLSPSQKMLTAALVAIMIMTLIMWGRYAGEPETVSLFSYPLAADKAGNVLTVLDANGIKATSTGDKILVPSDQKTRAYSLLAYANALPRADKDSFEEILKNVNPLQSESMTDRLTNHAREVSLGQLIGEFPEVADAKVMIAESQAVRIGGGGEPRASISIQTRDGAKGSQKLAEAAATLVEGTLSGLDRSKIHVVINGVAAHLKNLPTDGMEASDLQQAAHTAELNLEQKIREHFVYISGILVHVTCAVNNTKTEEHSTKFDGKNSVSKEKENHTISEENTNPAPTGGEGGAVPNSSVAVGGSATSGGGANTKESTDTKYENFVPTTEIHTQTPAGETKAMAAAVRVPYDYFVAAYKTFHKGSAEVSDAVLEPFVTQQLQSIKRDVMNATLLKDQDVEVNYYIDTTPTVAAAPAAPSVLSSTLLNTGRLKEVALGVLALVSLFMVSTVVKRGNGQPAVVSSTSVAPVDDVLEAREELAGTVGAADSSLTGLELDEESIRSQQVVKQVSGLVKENPDSAAAMVKRWLNEA